MTSSFYKILKDSKRRVMETAHEAFIDPNNKTVDSEYDVHAAKFPEMIKDMNECGASLNSSLMNQKKMFADSAELAKSLERIYHSNVTMTDWVNTTCHLEQHGAAAAFSSSWENIHSVIRSSSAMTMSELSLEPLRAAVTKMQPEIDAACKERNNKLIDYDSYRRRLKGLQTTKEKQQAKIDAGPSNAADAKSLEATVADISRYEAKLQTSEVNYKEDNDKVKDDIIKAKFAHDQLMDMLLITTIVCQAETFTRAANELNAIVSTLPIHKVDQVRRRMEQYIAQGGVHIEGAAPSNNAINTAMSLLTGKAVISDIQKAKEEKNVALDKQNADRLRAEAIVKEEARMKAGSSSSSNPFGDDERAPPVPSAPVPVAHVAHADPLPVAVPVASAASGGTARPVSISLNSAAKFRVIAIFDHNADAEDELGFVINDMIDIIDDTDEGWWYGRNIGTGKVGLFPANYTKKL